MRYYLILNPGSRSGCSSKTFKRIFRHLDNAMITYSYKLTQRLEDAYTFSLQANQEGYDVIVAVGGDGTINQVINGFYNENGKRISKSRFGVIYTGTSPDFCKSYGIPTRLDKAIEVIIQAKYKSIVIGKITFCNHAGEHGVSVTELPDAFTRYFACCANIGLGASLANKANSGIRKYMGDFLGTFTSLIGILFSYKPGSYLTIYNQCKRKINTCYNLSVGITPYIASGIRVPIAEGQRTSLYLMAACKLTLSTIFGVLWKIYRGITFENTENLWMDETGEIDILGNPANPDVEFDGDPAGYLPCKVSLAEDELMVLCGMEIDS